MLVFTLTRTWHWQIETIEGQYRHPIEANELIFLSNIDLKLINVLNIIMKK